MQLLLCLLLTQSKPVNPWHWFAQPMWSAPEWSGPEWSAQSSVRQQQPGASHSKPNLPKFKPSPPPTLPLTLSPPTPPIPPPLQNQNPTPNHPEAPPQTLTDSYALANPSFSYTQASYNSASINASRWHFSLPWLGFLEISSGLFLTSPGFIQPIYIISPEPLPITATAPGYLIQDHAIRPWLEPGSAHLYITFQMSP